MSEQLRNPKRRLWLDATLESEAEDSSAIPPVPVPPRHLRTHSPSPSAPDAKRRFAGPIHGRTRRRTPRPSDQADPMSGLLDSFSSISKPVGDLLDAPLGVNGSTASPVIPRVRPVRSYGGATDGALGDGSAADFVRSLRSEFAALDDVAEPPVVRMAKRPSGFSEITSPKPVPREHNPLRAYLRSARSRSTISLHSNDRDDDARSIGTVSIDNGYRRSLQAGDRISLDSRTSAKRGHLSLISMSSREQLRVKEIEAERRRELVVPSSPIQMSAFGPDSTSAASPRRIFAFETPIKEEEPSPPPAPASIPNSVASSSKKEGKRPMLVEDVGISGPLAGPTVPSRRSSLKMQDFTTPPRRRPHSPQSRNSSAAHASTGKTETVKEEEEPQPGPQFAPATVEPKVNLADVLDGEDTEVTKRIKELKAKKEQREREASQSPRSGLEPPNGERYSSPTAGPSGSRAPTESSKSGPSTRKRFEGEISVPTSSAMKPVNGDSTYLTSSNGVASEQPGTPLTPTSLPINYSYVVQSLNRDTSPSGKASENTQSSSAGRDKKKSKSLVVGNRTSSARAQTTRRSLNLDNSARKRSDSSPVRNGVEMARPSSPVASESALPRESSQPTSKVVKSNSTKKKHWSHPDLPASVERRSSIRGDSLAVKHPETVKEERPVTADSIDHQVNTFIRSPRLTQKIKHPQTGRIISFSEVGDPRGHAVFCCVGMGLTRFVTAFYDELASTLRLRLITPDRPGVGESQVDPLGTPLSWPDDVLAICTALRITKFSIIAHSAGAIYALATALRMPQSIRGRVHLLAPWIPPSQMAPIGLPKQVSAPAAALPRGQRFLRALPAPLLKVANTGLFSAASASLSPNGSQKPNSKRRSLGRDRGSESPSPNTKAQQAQSRAPSQAATRTDAPDPSAAQRRESIMLMDQQALPNGEALAEMRSTADLRSAAKKKGGANGRRKGGAAAAAAQRTLQDEDRRAEYDERLTIAIWNAATTGANPAVDLLVCLERSQPIGFRYVDITRAVVIHHGAKDARVPIENVRWLGRTMRRCEVRVLEGEGHGLMASASVMGAVLGEMSREWEDWERAVRSGKAGDEKLRERVRLGID